ncbi:hypothetical protein KCV03_g89, partial [Aureobasidium melanogenum]
MLSCAEQRQFCSTYPKRAANPHNVPNSATSLFSSSPKSLRDHILLYTRDEWYSEPLVDASIQHDVHPLPNFTGYHSAIYARRSWDKRTWSNIAVLKNTKQRRCGVARDAKEKAL